MTADQQLVASDAGVMKINALLAGKRAEVIAAGAAHKALVMQTGHDVVAGKKFAGAALRDARDHIANLRDLLVGLDNALAVALSEASQRVTKTLKQEIEEYEAVATRCDQRYDAILRNEIEVVIPADAPPSERGDRYLWKQRMLDGCRNGARGARGQADHRRDRIARLNTPSRNAGFDGDPDPH